MQIPTEWHVHILPGLILLLAAVPLFSNSKIAELRQGMPPSIKDLLGASIILGIVGYILGFVGNAIGLTILKPTLTGVGLLTPPSGSFSSEQWFWLVSSGKMDLAREISTGYQQMILLRSLFGAFLLLSISSIVGGIWRRNFLRTRVISTLIVFLSTWGIWCQWLAHRSSQYQFQTLVLHSLGF